MELLVYCGSSEWALEIYPDSVTHPAPLLCRRRLPLYATKFIEMVLMLTADHGPAVSGAMNTIVATRAGKDLISSLASGLLTIGSRWVSFPCFCY